ncbi:phage major capsid protein [Lutimaribacter sp. EGI FJ00015]|uniref:Phage major capsid protein n=1 Tax=Lutimaribacter degradans TaxID=2945989 RepID=A0ACC5ZU53_9RHOB|nr:phage major capsid protein [Lutimaribacter sp. EGI FJ00013]MCM2561350.1 phage major capsid protein [Lutimaribacter sp. EGI FJ00013]MCO0611699.1 phage major capsid protein [Lutimaribacter sp. EGI FJ00015]MCO0635179.1 phage major capsid protein [Lutimaribacter sp. EGI FJ00014]
MKHERKIRGIMAVRANASGDPKQVLAEMTNAFSQFKQDHKAEVRELQTGLDEVNQTLSALRIGGGGPASGGASERDRTEVNSALRKLIRDGDDAPLASLHTGINAGMSTDSNPDGGFTVVPYLSPVMTERLHAISPMRQLARTEVIATDVFEEIADTSLSGAEWVTEREARGDTASPTLHKLSVPVHEISAMPKVTQKLLDDSTFDLATWLTGNISQSFARKEGNAFINGDGINKPRGILSYDVSDDDDDTRDWGTLQTIASGEAADIDEDSLISLIYAIKPEYRAGASWIMNRKTAATVRKLKDGQGRFLWAESLAAGEPPRLLGFPVALDEEMPDIGAGERPIAFGDFASGYIIVDRIGLRLLRDPYTDKPNVRFYTTKRVGGALYNSEAIKLLRVGT